MRGTRRGFLRNGLLFAGVSLSGCSSIDEPAFFEQDPPTPVPPGEWSFFAPGGRIDSITAPSNGRIFVGGEQLSAVGTGSGEQRWAHDEAEGFSTVDGSTVYVEDGVSGGILALGQESGEVEWEYPRGDDMSAKPAVGDGAVFYAAQVDGVATVFAVEAENGEQRWKYQHGDDVDVVGFSSGVLVAGGESTRVVGIDTRTGEQRWYNLLDGYIQAGPAFSGTTGFVGSDGGTVLAFDVQSGEERWTKSLDRPVAGVVTNGKSVFVTASNEADDGYLYAFETGTGEQLYRVSTGPLQTRPAADDRIVYVSQGSEDDSSSMFYGFDAETGETVGQYEIDAFPEHPPVVTGDTIYLPEDWKLTAVSKSGFLG